MNDRNGQRNMDPWDRDFYETGSTRPPKSRVGLIAVLLILIIILCGIVTLLGMLNIRLFVSTQAATTPTDGAAFYPTDTDASTAAPVTDPTDVSLPALSGDASLKLEPSPEPVENIPQTGGLSLQAIYEKAIDSVVSISCVLEDGSASGTGVVLSDAGYIVTNCHVVEGARSISVLLTDGRQFAAGLVGADAVSDLAVLYIDADGLTPAEFGDSSSLRVGDAVAAIGDPLGMELRGTMTDGIVSAINREVSVSGRTMTLIQTNAALNSGNSGGPLLNCYGQVIGINTLKIGTFMDEAGVEGLGFAIPSTTVKEIVDQLMNQGYVSGRPRLGLECTPVSSYYQHFYSLPAGIRVISVVEGGPAAQAGLAAGDILLSIDGTRVTTTDELNAALYSHQVGDTVTLTVYRNYKQYSVTVTLGEATG